MIVKKTRHISRTIHSSPYLLAFFIIGLSGSIVLRSLPVTAYSLLGISWLNCPSQTRVGWADGGAKRVGKRLIIQWGPLQRHGSPPPNSILLTCYSAPWRTRKPAEYEEAWSRGSASAFLSWNSDLFCRLFRHQMESGFQFYPRLSSLLTGIFTHKRAHNEKVHSASLPLLPTLLNQSQFEEMTFLSYCVPKIDMGRSVHWGAWRVPDPSGQKYSFPSELKM